MEISIIGSVGVAASHLSPALAAASHVGGVVGSQIGASALAYATQNAANFGAQYLIGLAEDQGVKLLQQTRELRGYDFKPIKNTDLLEMDTKRCMGVLICSVPLGGLAGLATAGRHFVAIMISRDGEKQDRKWNTQLFNFTAYAFEFGSVNGRAMEGPSEVCISSFEMSIESRNRHKVKYYRKELINHGIRVESYKECNATLRNALDIAIAAGRKPYSLKSYNCKAYARTIFMHMVEGSYDIGEAGFQYVYDDANDRFMKFLANALIPVSRF